MSAAVAPGPGLSPSLPRASPRGQLPSPTPAPRLFCARSCQGRFHSCTPEMSRRPLKTKTKINDSVNILCVFGFL